MAGCSTSLAERARRDRRQVREGACRSALSRCTLGALIALLAGVAAGCASPAPPASESAPAFRIEVHPLATVTLTTPEILRGRTDGPPATIAAELRLPFAAPGRLPAVVFLHGDAGAIAEQPPWIDALVARGFAVLTVDSFTGRGAIAPDAALTSLRPPVGPFSRVPDAQRALALVAAHPRIDTNRIALMGASSGGLTTLLTAQQRFARTWGRPDLRYAAFISLYPPCNAEIADDTVLDAAPVRVFHGLADVVTSPDACRAYVERLRAAGRDAVFVGYASAPHGFDGPDAWPRQEIADIPTFGRCRLRESEEHTLVNTDTGRAPAMADACVGRGIVGGPDPVARRAVHQAVVEFLSAVLRPGP